MNEIPANEIPANEIRTNGIQMNDIRKLLAAAISPEQKTAILGCGSILRGDDAAGCRIAERLSDLDGNAKAFYGGNAPENLTGEIKRFCPDMLLVIDAAGLEQPPGTVAFVPPESVSGATFSTHMLPLNVMLNYLQRETGCGVRLLGIQAASLASGTEMTPAVNAAVDMIVSVLLELLGKQ
ncbi:MAG: hydrogenase 3 maturation endopeptidase HyCI [Treponema sp.]|nr:hydrogenase 3 maturation endopeptidase HyCI [Treponema sp.]